MTYSPEARYGPVKTVVPPPGAATPEVVKTPYFCVDCSLGGIERPLAAVFQVSGTVLCKDHAIQWRKAM